MKAGWKTVRLEEVCAVEFGERVVRKNDSGTMYPVYGGGGATFNIDRYNRESCVVVSRFGMSERCVRFVEGKFFLNDSGLTVTSISPEASQGYIDLLLHAKAPEIYALGGGTAQKNLDTKSFRNLEIPLPPMAEQKRIVALLDEAFTGIDEAKAKAEANLENATHLFRSHTQSIFSQRIDGWPTKQLSDICDFEGGSQPPKSKFIYSQKPGYVRFLQIRDFGSDKYVTFIPESKKNRHCEESDILIARYGASVGKILTGKSGAYNVALMKTLPDLTQLDLNFFHQYLTSGAFQNQLVKVAARSAQNGFSKEDIHAFPVPVPPLAEQRRVIQQLNPLSELCQTLSTSYGRKKGLLADLKASLLAKAFAGELTA